VCLLGVGLHKCYSVCVCVCMCGGVEGGVCLLSHVAPKSVETRFIRYHSGVKLKQYSGGVIVVLEWCYSSDTVCEWGGKYVFVFVCVCCHMYKQIP
jgi:hypothetical protein